MKQNRLFLICALLLPVAACDRHLVEEDIAGAEDSIYRIEASLERGDATKTVLSEPDNNGIYYPNWSKSDVVAVYADGLPVAGKYTLSEGDGTVNAVFKGDLTGERLVGLFPYSFRTEEGLKDQVLSLNLPRTQEYVKSSFGSEAFPMVAVGTPEDLSFKNLCAVLRLSMTGEESVASIKFTALDAQMVVSGKGTVRTDFADLPELAMAEGGSNSVTLECGSVSLNKETPTDFFLVIPSGTYKGGFTLEIKTFAGTVTKSTSSDIVFKRSQLRSIPVFECVGNGEIDPDNIPYNQIWYKSSNGRVYDVSPICFDREIVSNTYENGQGVLSFDGPVTRVGTMDYWLVAFGDQITEIILPNSVEHICSNAFYGTQFSSFRTPDNLQTVENQAFFNNTSLSRVYGKWASKDEKAIILSDGTMVAYAMAALEANLVIPDGTKTIIADLFNNQSVLETVSLPESVDDIGLGVFMACPNLREFKGESSIIYDDRTLISKDYTLAAIAGKGLTDYVIPEGVRLDYGAFTGNKELKSVTFPSSSRGASSVCFNGCDNLEFFYGPGTSEDHHCWIMNLMGYGNSLWNVTPVCPSDFSPTGFVSVVTFSHNSYIERLTFEDDVNSIWDYALQDMPKLRYLRLPAFLSSFGRNPIGFCQNLDSIYVRSYAPPSFSEDEWAHIGHPGLHIFVPEGMEDLYKSASGWANYADYIEGFHYDDLAELDYYISKDYSHDRKITTLQTATEGEGINLILLGDAFSDRQIEDGSYDAAMRKMMDAFFSEEPYSTYKNLFNVYAITVVSATEGYEHGGQALGTWFGDGTQVGGDNTTCMELARMVVPAEKMDDALIIVAMNRDYYAGTCYMYNPSGEDFGRGLSVAYFPTSSDESTFNGLVRHEAGGHGFAKLGDEYAYEYLGAIPEAEKRDAMTKSTFGWWKNVDFTGDPSVVKWAKFLEDEWYQYDGLGVFEGGFTYWSGVWRPTEESIMNHNQGGFNAPSREAIWYRLHKLAYGADWQYNYEDFVAYDAKNRKAASGTSSIGIRNFVERPMEPTHPPVVIPRRWNEPAPAGESQRFRDSVNSR